MYRSGLFVVVAAVLSGCVTPPPPPPPIMAYQPPPEPLHRPRPLVKHPAVTPTPRPREAPPQNEPKAAVPPVSKPPEGTLTALTVGNYMDDQEKDLRRMLRGSGVAVSRVGDSLVLNISDDSLFAGSSGGLSQKGRAIVHAIAGSTRKFNSTLLFVNGFSDTAATAAEAVRRTQKNANAVGEALADDGIDLRRISAKGYGAESPKIPTGPNAREPRNRRIEIDIAPRMKG